MVRDRSRDDDHHYLIMKTIFPFVSSFLCVITDKNSRSIRIILELLVVKKKGIIKRVTTTRTDRESNLMIVVRKRFKKMKEKGLVLFSLFMLNGNDQIR